MYFNIYFFIKRETGHEPEPNQNSSAIHFSVVTNLFRNAVLNDWHHWPQVDGRLPAIEQRYEELESLSAARRQALEGALALYRMFSEAGACLLWVEEKEQWLDGMEIPTKLEDLEVVQQRLVVWLLTNGPKGPVCPFFKKVCLTVRLVLRQLSSGLPEKMMVHNGR